MNASGIVSAFADFCSVQSSIMWTIDTGVPSPRLEMDWLVVLE